MARAANASSVHRDRGCGGRRITDDGHRSSKRAYAFWREHDIHGCSLSSRQCGPADAARHAVARSGDTYT